MRSKKNKKKLIIAIVLGCVATLGLLNNMNSQKAAMNRLNKKIQAQQKADIKKKNPFETKKADIKAVVAAKDINVGDVFLLESLNVKNFADKDELPAGYFKTKAMVVGKKAGKNITRGGFITGAEIQVADSNTIDIPNDTRAITIPVEKFKGLASYIKIGSRVDILKITNPPEFIAQNVKVVGFEKLTAPVSTVKNPIKESLNAKKASAITFLIPIDIVPTLIDSMLKGQLQIIVRNNQDEKIVTTEKELPPPPSAEKISVIPLPSPEKDTNLPEPKPISPPAKEIELIQANRISKQTFKPNDFQSVNEKKDNSISAEKLKQLLDLVN